MNPSDSWEDWDDRSDPRAERRSFGDEPWADAGRRRQVRCWRCEKVAVPMVGGRCPYCRAKVETAIEDRILVPESKQTHPILKVLAVLGAMTVAIMVVSLVYYHLLRHAAEQQLPTEAEWDKQQIRWMFVAAAAEAVVVIAGFIWIGWLPPLSKPDWQWRLTAWIWGLPVLGGLLFLNLGYHWLLKQYVRPSGLPPDPPLTVLSWVAICVLPAVIEEFVFRYLAINSLRPHMGLHATVWVSSAMFGMAHIGNPLGIPILTVVGAGLGYMRILSGGLLLPMLMHMLHNMVVLYLGSNV